MIYHNQLICHDNLKPWPRLARNLPLRSIRRSSGLSAPSFRRKASASGPRRRSFGRSDRKTQERQSAWYLRYSPCMPIRSNATEARTASEIPGCSKLPSIVRRPAGPIEGSCEIGFPRTPSFLPQRCTKPTIQPRQACPMPAQSRKHFLMIAVQRRHFIGHHRKALQPRISE